MYQNVRKNFGKQPRERDFEMAIDEENDVEATDCDSCATLAVTIFWYFSIRSRFVCVCVTEKFYL